MLEFNFSPFPFLHTERLFLRRLSDEDAIPLFRLRSDPKVMQFVGRPAPKELREVQDLIDSINLRIDKNESIFWGFESLSQPGLIGTIGFWQILSEHHRAEVGYLLDPSYWGQGIMTEALHAVVDYGFSTMKLHSVQAEIHAKNFASARVLQKLRFKREAYFQENFYWEEAFHDSEIYSLLASQWRPMKKT